MIAGLLGFVAFVLLLFVIGGLMEHNTRKAGLFFGAMMVCGAAIIWLDEPVQYGSADECWIEWDGRSNPTVCY